MKIWLIMRQKIVATDRVAQKAVWSGEGQIARPAIIS